MTFPKLSEIVTLPIRFIVIVAIATGFLLFLPSEAMESLRLKAFVDQYGLYVGIAFLVSTVWIFVAIITNLWNPVAAIVKQKYVSYQTGKQIKNSISAFDPSELAVLREFIRRKENTIQLPVDDPVVAGLVKQDVIEFVSDPNTIGLNGPLVNYRVSSKFLPHLSPAIAAIPEQLIKFDTNDDLIISEALDQWLTQHEPNFTR